MAARSAARQQAEQRERDVKRMLRSRHLPPQVTTQLYTGGGGFEYWQVNTSTPIVVDLGLEGDWTIAMYWKYRDVPGGAVEAVLADSSISLNVRHAFVASDQFECLVRYDVERLGDLQTSRGPHVQTYQFNPLFDRIHYLTVGLPAEFDWDAGSVVEFMSSVLPRDLADNGWPTT